MNVAAGRQPQSVQLAFISAPKVKSRRPDGWLTSAPATHAAGLAPAAALARRMYASLGAGVFELLWLAGRPAGAVGDRFTMTPDCAAALRDAAALGRGVVVVVATAPAGNWDLSACGAARWMASGIASAPRLTVVTKRLSWRALDRYWQRLRAERGVVLVGAAAAVREALRAGGLVGLLVDQAPERASGVVTLPFLGRPARHDLAPALFPARVKAPLVVVLGRRGGDGRHELEVAATILPAELRGRGALEAATGRIAEAVEGFVRARPEQWLHRRWK